MVDKRADSLRKTHLRVRPRHDRVQKGWVAPDSAFPSRFLQAHGPRLCLWRAFPPRRPFRSVVNGRSLSTRPTGHCQGNGKSREGKSREAVFRQHPHGCCCSWDGDRDRHTVPIAQTVSTFVEERRGQRWVRHLFGEAARDRHRDARTVRRL